MKIFLKIGDITKEIADAIVNAANSSLRGGGGVDGAIHRAGGPKILEECLAIGYCAPGAAVITSGGNLPAKHVIHTVGPIWRGGEQGEAKTLASCYREAIRLAIRHDLGAIAFPSISTGVYGYPVDLAADVAIGTVIEEYPPLTLTWTLFDQRTYDAYFNALRQRSR